MTTAYKPVTVIAPEVANVISATVPPLMERPTTITHYDKAGRVKEVIDPLNGSTIPDFDNGGRAYRVTAPPTGVAPNIQTHITLNVLDPAGNILQVINPKNQTVTNVYDAFGRLTTTTDHNDITNEFDTMPLERRSIQARSPVQRRAAATR